MAEEGICSNRMQMIKANKRYFTDGIRMQLPHQRTAPVLYSCARIVSSSVFLFRYSGTSSVDSWIPSYPKYEHTQMRW